MAIASRGSNSLQISLFFPNGAAPETLNLGELVPGVTALEGTGAHGMFLGQHQDGRMFQAQLLPTRLDMRWLPVALPFVPFRYTSASDEAHVRSALGELRAAAERYVVGSNRLAVFVALQQPVASLREASGLFAETGGERLTAFTDLEDVNVIFNAPTHLDGIRINQIYRFQTVQQLTLEMTIGIPFGSPPAMPAQPVIAAQWEFDFNTDHMRAEPLGRDAAPLLVHIVDAVATTVESSRPAGRT